MVLADEVNPVNRLYRELSGRYKAGWTFHRFLLGLRKFFGSEDLDDRTSDFRSLYQKLREVSLRLNDLDMPPVVEDLEKLQRRLDSLIDALDVQDAKISTSLVRLFFQRVKTQDERILIELIRFYLEVQSGRDWLPGRIDKVDFLLSRLGHGIAGHDGGGDRERLNRVLGGISDYLGRSAPVDPQKVANRMKLIQAVRQEIEKVESFDALTERDLVGHYRNLKHGLGALLFDKSILPLIVSTNLVVSRRVNELTDQAQATIFGDYERVSALEKRGLLSRDLAESVSKLHDQVGSFKKQVDSGTLRIDAIAEIRGSVQGIVGNMGLEESSDARAELAGAEDLSAEGIFRSKDEAELLEGVFEDLVEALRASHEATGTVSGLDSGLLEYRLGSREIAAFARLSTGADCDPEVERFVLAAASLRRKLTQLIDDLHGSGAETGSGGRGAVVRDAIRSLRIADLYLRRFDHELEVGLAASGKRSAMGLQVSKMYLMREYAELWLLMNSGSD